VAGGGQHRLGVRPLEPLPRPPAGGHVEIAVLAWLFLDERPSVGQVAAIAVVTVGVVAGTGALGTTRPRVNGVRRRR
jgi:hypothetical protein